MRLSQICIAIAQLGRGGAWSPRSLWPDGIASPGMWISPRDLTSQWQDYTGTTPVVTPGTVADSSNPVGLALDIRAGATVLTDPGNHMLQSTSAARPLMSARVNLLTYTEDFADTSWVMVEVTRTQNVAVAPDDTTTASLAVPTTVSENHRVRYSTNTAVPTAGAYSVYVKSAGYLKVGLREDEATGALAAFDLASGGSVIATSGAAVSSPVIEAVGNDWYRISATFSGVNPLRFAVCVLSPAYTSGGASSWAANGTDGVYIWGAQLELDSAAAAYQSVPGNGSTYATDFPIYQKYDGTDDGMATATFAAGTLTSAMDCMIAVRRDSGAACVAGLYNGIADATKFFGMAESASGSGCVGSGAGTPTVWVDGVQLSGGTAVTRGTLHTALTVGDWHILEFRGLDLSTWTAAGFGLYTSYVFPGARSDIMLYPSTDSTADKDAARQYLADYYGVTLP